LFTRPANHHRHPACREQCRSTTQSSIRAVQERAEALAHLRGLAKTRTLTLLTASKAADISEATVLAGLLQ
jgi:uncharacterized protein YeaO (DUF488 family)